MRTVEEIKKDIDELEIERAEAYYGGFEYDTFDAELQYLYTLLDKAKGGVY